MSRDLADILNDLRGQHSHEMGEALKRIGKATLEMETDKILPLAAEYYEARGKVVILDDLLENIAMRKQA